jgi:hypothetical protein
MFIQMDANKRNNYIAQFSIAGHQSVAKPLASASLSLNNVLISMTIYNIMANCAIEFPWHVFCCNSLSICYRTGGDVGEI